MHRIYARAKPLSFNSLVKINGAGIEFFFAAAGTVSPARDGRSWRIRRDRWRPRSDPGGGGRLSCRLGAIGVEATPLDLECIEGQGEKQRAIPFRRFRRALPG